MMTAKQARSIYLETESKRRKERLSQVERMIQQNALAGETSFWLVEEYAQGYIAKELQDAGYDISIENRMHKMRIFVSWSPKGEKGNE